MGVKVTVRGTRTAGRRLSFVADRSADVSRAWPAVGSYLARSNWRQFTSQGAYYGTPWRPLKPEYRLAKIRAGLNRKILVRTGLLRRSFTSRPMSVERYMGNRAEFGSDRNTARWHHYGTRRNGKRVNPPRPILKVTPLMAKDVRDILARYITTGKTP